MVNNENPRRNIFFRICCCCCNCLRSRPFTFTVDDDHDHDQKQQQRQQPEENFQLKSHEKNLDHSNEISSINTAAAAAAAVTNEEMKINFHFPIDNNENNVDNNNNNTSSFVLSSSSSLMRKMNEKRKNFPLKSTSSLKLLNVNTDSMIDYQKQQMKQMQQQRKYNNNYCKDCNEIKSRTRNSSIMISMLKKHNNNENNNGFHHHFHHNHQRRQQQQQHYNFSAKFNDNFKSWTMDNRQIMKMDHYLATQSNKQQSLKFNNEKVNHDAAAAAGTTTTSPSLCQQQQKIVNNSMNNDVKNNDDVKNINDSSLNENKLPIDQQNQRQSSIIDDIVVLPQQRQQPPTSISYLLHDNNQEHEEKHDERPIDVGWVGGWASDFDILLSDPIGIKAFTDFLRKEFSYENLQFFLTVQEFKNLTDLDEIRKKSHEIYEKFLAVSAPEPVNVDSRARKSVESGLKNPNKNIFSFAEEQIYNLMKFDSYVRFLKSDIYEKCSLLDLKGEPLPYENDNIINDASCDTTKTNSASTSQTKNTGSLGLRSGHQNGKNNPTAVKKRRSFIPWARLKSSINHKAASLSSMAAPSSATTTKAEMFGSKKQYMMRKLTDSIHKIRSKSLDEHLTNHVNNKASQSIGSETHSNNSSIDKSSIISNGQKNPYVSISRSSLMPHSSDSIDSVDHNVFTSSPDNLKSVEIIDPSSLSSSNSISSGTMDHLKPQSGSDPVSPSSLMADQPVSSTTTSSSSFNHNCNRDNCHLLRIVFPDRSQTVVPSSPNETINNLLKKLFEKRSLKYTAWDVFITGQEKPLDLSTNTTQLGCVELRVEQRVIFRIEFPSQDIIGVKTRPTKLCSEVFHPLLMRYGYRPEHTVITIAETEQVVPQKSPVSVIDGQHIVVSYFDDLEEWGWDTTRNNIPVALSLAGKSFSEDNGMKSKKKDDETIECNLLMDQQQATSVPSVATYHNLGSIRDHLLVSRYIAAKNNSNKATNNENNNNNFECSPQPDSYDSPNNTSSSTPGDDTQSDMFFRELMKNAHTVPSPPRGPSSSSTYSAAYGILNNNNSHSNENIKQLQSMAPISNTSRMPVKTSSRNSSLRDLQNHRHFKTYQPSPLAYEPATVLRSHEMIRKQITPEIELNQTISSNSSPSINTLPLDHQHRSLHFEPMAENNSNKLQISQPEKPPLRRQKSDPPPQQSQEQPPPLPPKINTTIIQANTTNINNVCPPRPPPRATISLNRNHESTGDNDDNNNKDCNQKQINPNDNNNNNNSS